MRALDERDQLEPWEICDICQILSPSLAGVLARMDDLGIITRTRVPEDQRRVIVKLSPKGEALVAQMAPLVQAQYRKLEDALGSELLGELYAVIDKVINGPHPPVERIPLPIVDAQAAGKDGSAAGKRTATRKASAKRSA